MKKTVTVILPAYNEEASVPLMETKMRELSDLHDGYNWHFLVIDDGSDDRTLELVRRLAASDPRFEYVSLSRNFGKENAVLAGLDHARGDAVIIMDADMQHPVEAVGGMLRHWEEGAKDVFATRQCNGERLFKRTSSKAYYRILNRFSEVPVPYDAGDFRLLDRECVDAFRLLREDDRSNKSLFCWIGFDKASVPFRQNDRKAGLTKFSSGKLFRLAYDGFLTVSSLPLKIIMSVAGLLFFAAIILTCWIIAFAISDTAIPAVLSLSCVICWVSALQSLCLCLIGAYVERIFKASRRRPPYLVKEKMVSQR